MVNKGLIEKLQNIKLIATDCDGVLTDGGLYYTEDGIEFKKFNVLDGMGFVLLKEYGVKTAIITGENNKLVENRAKRIQVDYLFMGTKDKIGVLTKICNELEIDLSEAVYIGDDIIDIPAIEKSGVGVVPSGALDYVQAKADYITKRTGGNGCFREIADMIINAKENSMECNV